MHWQMEVPIYNIWVGLLHSFKGRETAPVNAQRSNENDSKYSSQHLITRILADIKNIKNSHCTKEVKRSLSSIKELIRKKIAFSSLSNIMKKLESTWKDSIKDNSGPEPQKRAGITDGQYHWSNTQNHRWKFLTQQNNRLTVREGILSPSKEQNCPEDRVKQNTK